MFDIYVSLMKALHVDWLSRRQQFSSMTASAAAARMVSTTRILLVLRLLWEKNSWASTVLVSIWRTSCDEVWLSMIPVDGILSHYLVGITIMRLNDASSTFTNGFVLLLHKEVCYPIIPVSYSWIFMHPIWDLFGWSIHSFSHSDIFYHNHCRWWGQGFFGGFVYPLLLRLCHPWFSHVGWKLVGFFNLEVGIVY